MRPTGEARQLQIAGQLPRANAFWRAFEDAKTLLVLQQGEAVAGPGRYHAAYMTRAAKLASAMNMQPR